MVTAVGPGALLNYTPKPVPPNPNTNSTQKYLSNELGNVSNSVLLANQAIQGNTTSITTNTANIATNTASITSINGTIAVLTNSEAQNLVFASPNGSAGAPSFRALATADLANSLVTYAKIQNVTAARLLGNPTGSAAAPSEISLGSGLSFSGSVLNTTPQASGLTYLGTVSVSAGALADTTILAANNGTYRSFLLIVRQLVSSVALASPAFQLQVHSGGSFQTTSYVASVQSNNGTGIGSGQSTTGIPLCQSANTNSDPGLSSEIRVANLSSTTVKKIWWCVSALFGASTPAAQIAQGGGWWNGGNGAIDGFQIVPSSGTLSSGNVDIYGVQ